MILLGMQNELKCLKRAQRGVMAMACIYRVLREFVVGYNSDVGAVADVKPGSYLGVATPPTVSGEWQPAKHQ